MRAWHRIRQLLFVSLVLAAAAAGVGLSNLLANGSRLLSVQSGSMVPALNKGDLISVRKTPTRDLRVGDVITYSQPAGSNQTITHRIVSIPGDMNGRVVTKGDANASADMSVLPSQIIGRVERSLPYAGYAADFVRQPIGLALVIYLPAAVLIVNEIRRLSGYYRSGASYGSQADASNA